GRVESAAQIDHFVQPVIVAAVKTCPGYAPPALIHPPSSDSRSQFHRVPVELAEDSSGFPGVFCFKPGFDPKGYISTVDPRIGDIEPAVRQMKDMYVGKQVEGFPQGDFQLQRRLQHLVQVTPDKAVVGMGEVVFCDIGNPCRGNKMKGDRTGLGQLEIETYCGPIGRSEEHTSELQSRE